MTREAAPVLVYLHGFRSSPQSVKARQVAAAVARLPQERRPVLHVPELDDRPARAIESVMACIASHVGGDAAQRLALIGSSLGGYYATWLAERTGARAVMINPTTQPYEDLRPHAGTQVNLYTGRTFEVTPAHFRELEALRVERITRPERYFLLVQTGDEVLDYRRAVAHYAGAWQYVQGGGDHAFQHFVEQIPAILRFAGIQGPYA